MASAKTAVSKGSARERLLAAAGELFYAEGVQSVGIDRVIERAGVAKASLYSSFGSKQELVRAYLEARGQKRQRMLSERVALHTEPRARILAIFDVLADVIAEPNYRGCAFVNVSAEAPGNDRAIGQVCSASRTWVRELFTKLASELGAQNPSALARKLALLYDGVVVRAAMERDPTVAADARELAELVLDAHTPRQGRAKSGVKKRVRAR